MAQEVERYRKPTRVLHWVHLCAFVVLFLTGLILFIPGLAALAEDSWTRVIHRVAAVVFIIAPLVYMSMNWQATWRGIKEAFTWGADDVAWLFAAPRYYMLCDEKAMPPQPHINAGQKLWWFIALVFGAFFVITGLIMWFFKELAPAALLQWMVFSHDVAFIVSGAMLFVHVYLSFHPLMRPLKSGPWNSMIGGGTVSVEYAKSHHGKWYDEVSKGKKEA
jgi:formate dehydrogenase subunit gamma